MKNFKIIAIAIFTMVLASMYACNENPIDNTNLSQGITGDASTPRITINVTKNEQGFYEFRVRNNTVDTIINDFHVQFDTSMTISGWVYTWQQDPQTTDLNHGRIGIKTFP